MSRGRDKIVLRLMDADVCRSCLTKDPKTFSSRLGEGNSSKRSNDRGKYEMQIIDRFGEISEVLDKT